MSRYLTLTVVAVLVAAACSSTPADDSSSSTTAAATAVTATMPVSTTVAPTTTTTEDITLLLTSPSFDQNGTIPTEFSCDGDDLSPELNIENLPDNTVSLALIMDDPDAPGGTWDHWVAFDFPPTDTIPEDIPLLGIGGSNSWGVTGYGGPCPPPGTTHRYFFKLFALNGTLELAEGSTKEEVLQAMEGQVLDQTELVGTYARP